MKKLLFATLFIIQTSLSASAYAKEEPVSLFDIYQLAEKGDPIYLSSEANYFAQQQSNPQSWAAVLPQISFSAYRSNVKQDIKSTTSFVQSYDSNGYTLRISQALFRQSDFIRISQSNATVLKAQADFDSAKHDLIIRVATNYFNVLAAKDDVNFNRREYKALKRRLLQSEQKFQVGLIAITDVQEALARHDQSTAQVITAKNKFQITLENLRELTGEIHTNIKSLTSDIPLLSPEPENINDWVKLALTNNLNLRAAKQLMQIAKDEIAIQRAGHLPTLDLVAERSYSKVGGGFFGSRAIDQNSISLEFNLPLYAGGRTSSKTTQARYEYNAARQQYIQSQRATERLTRSGYLNVLSNISQVKALKQAVTSGDKALETTQAGFEVGTRTTVDVLNSQRELFRAKKDYARARYDYLLETLRLKKAAGILTVNDLKQMSNWIQ